MMTPMKAPMPGMMRLPSAMNSSPAAAPICATPSAEAKLAPMLASVPSMAAPAIADEKPEAMLVPRKVPIALPKLAPMAAPCESMSMICLASQPPTSEPMPNSMLVISFSALNPAKISAGMFGLRRLSTTVFSTAPMLRFTTVENSCPPKPSSPSASPSSAVRKLDSAPVACPFRIVKKLENSGILISSTSSLRLSGLSASKSSSLLK
jgi:hypothetical protein